jgi:hypothetical protein
VVEKRDFRDIQRKIPQKSDISKKWDSNPVPHGEIAGDIAKIFAKIFCRKSVFATKNPIFAEIRSGVCEFPQGKGEMVAKIGFSNKNTIFAVIICKHLIFAKKFGNYCLLL